MFAGYKIHTLKTALMEFYVFEESEVVPVRISDIFYVAVAIVLLHIMSPKEKMWYFYISKAILLLLMF